MLPQYGKDVSGGDNRNREHRYVNGKDKDRDRDRNRDKYDTQYNTMLQWVNLCLIVVLAIIVLTLHLRGGGVYTNSHQHVRSLAIKRRWKSYTFDTIKTNTDTFEKYPIPDMVFEKVQMYRLCCRTPDFYICDYGQGATADLGIECMLHTENEKDVFAAIWTGNKDLSQCTLYWV